ncbi:hypothetical protein CDCA_CDCA11G3180 [Cyanidium caldarium]|uniref:26S proteasome regulatory subunit RPN2 C-terminal domain-containing protein n=1 Tax=Cyanidium caldarium TaxID=2771 RepID=A0AAV9IXU5_CYACA|nr:hypothetical protein CDCA_CDCA11G3180 [Cyanidium caldarium]
MNATAAPALSLLEEHEPELQRRALVELDGLIDACWPEVAAHLPRIQELSEDESLAEEDRQRAALLAAKVLFHLSDLDEAVVYALAAGAQFRVDERSEFSRALRAKCIDRYVAMRTREEAGHGVNGWMDADGEVGAVSRPALEAVVNRILKDCLQANELKEALGMSLEALRLDAASEVIEAAASQGERASALAYALECWRELVGRRQQRERVLRFLIQEHGKYGEERTDFVAVCRCMSMVHDADGIADILERLLRSGRMHEAYQIGFDLWDADMPLFTARILEHLRKLLLPSEPSGADGSAEAPDSLRQSADALARIMSGATPSALFFDFLRRRNCYDKRLLKSLMTRLLAPMSLAQSAVLFANAFALAGTADDSFLRENLEWLSRATNCTKFSATASLGVIHAFHDSQALNLLSPYLPSLSGATAHSAYSEGGALYALGLIAASGVEVAKQQQFRAFLLEALRRAGTNEVVQHGGCLGLGLAALGVGRADEADGAPGDADAVAAEDGEIFQELRNVLYTDSALAGEAAALAMGMVMLGTGNQAAVADMLDYARETQHQKIVRGLALGLALVVLETAEEADALIDEMCGSNDAALRCGGVYAAALAYCGTAHNGTIRRLLHIAVSDVSDDVRRTAVLALGLVFARQPAQLPRVVSLLAESYNPHIRYGTAMALGIAGAGTGLREAGDLLHQLATDTVGFVRQGALIALAMVYQHHHEARSPAVAGLRKQMDAVARDKHEDVLAKFGAALALGIIDAGGRNAEIALRSRLTGSLRPGAVVGMTLFTQYWYWFPMTHCLCLALRPAAAIAVNDQMQLLRVRWETEGGAEAQRKYTYAVMYEEEGGRSEKRREKTVLSVTAKADQLKKARMAGGRGEHEERLRAALAAHAPSGGNDEGDAEQMQVEEDKKEKDGKKESAQQPTANDEPSSASEGVAEESAEALRLLENPARVLAEQEPLVQLHRTHVQGGYRPMRRGTGIVVVQRRRRGEAGGAMPDGQLREEDADEVIPLLPVPAPAPPRPSTADAVAAGGPGAEEDDGDEGDEPPPPEPFEYTGNVSGTSKPDPKGADGQGKDRSPEPDPPPPGSA